MAISVIILTYNSESVISATLDSARMISDDIHVVDSLSVDKTVEIAKDFGANVVSHAFENYGKQRNWAIENLPLKYGWELHLDADERPSDKLIQQINDLKISFPEHVEGYYIPRLTCFMGSEIRHGGLFPIWHLRLFRRGSGRCENRRYDQHFYVNGTTEKLTGHLIDDQKMSLSEWVARHNNWAEAEACELSMAETEGRIQPSLTGSPVQRKRFLRKFYNSFPLFVRPFLLFFYRYFLRLGFLDGRAGLIYYVLQTFWFRFLIDAKLYELRLAKESKQSKTLKPHKLK